MAVADRGGMQHGAIALALALLMVCIWSMTHRYRELSGDADLYAVQALAKFHPALASDLYLRNDSQDRYTVFSPLYAKLIAAVGLHPAARDLFLAATAWFFAAAWVLSRRLAGPGTAWFALAMLMVTTGRYGAYGVFSFAEGFMTARLVAEALIVTALACHFSGARVLGLGIAAAALLMHPLMALPGLLLLLCLWAGLRFSIAGALIGICVTAMIATLALLAPRSAGLLALIDEPWLAVVRERSQFLFLQLWHFADWKINALPFASLALTMLVVPDGRIRQLAWAAMLVGATGLVVAWIAGTIGPVAILMQGQAWRWMWIPTFAGILLLAPTLAWLWRDPKCGRVCALLIIGGWTCTAIDVWPCIGLTALLWLARPYFSERIAGLLRWAALGLALVLIGWTLANAWTTVGAPSPETGRETLWLTFARNILGLQTATLMLFGIAWAWIGTRRSVWVPAIACLPLGALAATALPGAMKELVTAGTPAEIAAFADWRNTIPAASNVAVIGVHNPAAFVWFTLERPGYLSIDQSAGVVFSRATALEVQRRAEVLSPLVEPSWKVMTLLAKRANGKPPAEIRDRPLTSAALIGLCRDTQLDFVIAREFAGFDPLQHMLVGAYRDWYLYDCRHVRAVGAPT